MRGKWAFSEKSRASSRARLRARRIERAGFEAVQQILDAHVAQVAPPERLDAELQLLIPPHPVDDVLGGHAERQPRSRLRGEAHVHGVTRAVGRTEREGRDLDVLAPEVDARLVDPAALQLVATDVPGADADAHGEGEERRTDRPAVRYAEGAVRRAPRRRVPDPILQEAGRVDVAVLTHVERQVDEFLPDVPADHARRARRHGEAPDAEPDPVHPPGPVEHHTGVRDRVEQIEAVPVVRSEPLLRTSYISSTSGPSINAERSNAGSATDQPGRSASPRSAGFQPAAS